MFVQHHDTGDSQKTCDNGRSVTLLWRRTASHPLRDTGTGDTVTENTSNAVSQYCNNPSFEERKQNSWSRNAFYTKFRSALGNGPWHMSLRCHYKLGVCRTELKWKEGKYLFHLTFVIVFFFNYVLSIFVRFHRMATCNSSENAVDLHRSSPLPVTYTKVST